MEKLKIGVIGFGFIGKIHCSKVQQSELAELVLVIDYPEKQAEVQGLYPQVQFSEQINDAMSDLDAVLITSPTSTHGRYIAELQKYKLPLFCEKPVLSLEDFKQEKFQPLIKENFIQVGHSERYHQIWDSLGQKIKQHKGLIRIQRSGGFHARVGDVSVLEDLMIHDLDLLTYFFGKEVRIEYAVGQKVFSSQYDIMAAQLTFSDKLKVEIMASRCHSKVQRQWEFFGKNESFCIDLYKNQWIQLNQDNQVEAMDYPKRDHLKLEQQDFFKAILEQKKPKISGSEGLDVLALADGILSKIS